MYVDVKVTTWQRVKIEDEATEQQVIKTIKEGNHFSLWDEELAYDFEPLTDTEEEMTPEENDGQATIEVYNDDRKLLWSNEVTES